MKEYMGMANLAEFITRKLSLVGYWTIEWSRGVDQYVVENRRVCRIVDGDPVECSSTEVYELGRDMPSMAACFRIAAENARKNAEEFERLASEQASKDASI